MSLPLPAQILDHIFHKYDSRFRCRETTNDDKFQLITVSRLRTFDERRIRVAELLSRWRIRNKPEKGITSLTITIPVRPTKTGTDNNQNRLRSNAKRKFEMSYVRELYIQRDHPRNQDFCLFTTRTFEVFDSCGQDYRLCLGKPDSVEYDQLSNCDVFRVYRGVDQERLAMKLRRIERIGIL